MINKTTIISIYLWLADSYTALANLFIHFMHSNDAINILMSSTASIINAMRMAHSVMLHNV